MATYSLPRNVRVNYVAFAVDLTVKQMQAILARDEALQARGIWGEFDKILEKQGAMDIEYHGMFGPVVGFKVMFDDLTTERLANLNRTVRDYAAGMSLEKLWERTR